MAGAEREQLEELAGKVLVRPSPSCSAAVEPDRASPGRPAIAVKQRAKSPRAWLAEQSRPAASMPPRLSTFSMLVAKWPCQKSVSLLAERVRPEYAFGTASRP